jgi:hypothetical protein
MGVSHRRTWALVVLVAALIVGAVGAWFAVATNGADTATVAIDERTGAYRGVRFGTSERDVIRALGKPDRGPGFAPAGENPSQVGVPESIPAVGPGGLLKYKGVGFLGTPRGGVYAFIVTQAGARTRRGVSIGDGMDVARSKYHLECSEVAGGESLLDGQEFYPSCSARLGHGIRIWFGRDPIRSITLVSVSHLR